MKTTAQRFRDKVDMTAGPDGCWLWMGASNGRYGQIRIPPRGRLVGAHRYAYELRNGAIPGGAVVMHTCDTPAYVNPAHLALGTQAENLADAGAKGHMSRRRSHCKRGHAFSGSNLAVHRDGSRRCRECTNAPRRKAAHGQTGTQRTLTSTAGARQS